MWQNFLSQFKISKSEWRFVVIVTILLIAITTVPYVYGYLNTPAGSEYVGIHSLTPGDISVYYSYILQAKSGHFIFRNLFTTEIGAYDNFNILWLSVGLIARIFNFSPMIAFQIARIILIPFLMTAIYLLIAYFFNNEKSIDTIKKRQTAFILMTVGSGVGTLFSFFLDPLYSDGLGFYNRSMDLWVAESNTFLTIYHTPHFIASLALIILVFLLILIALKKNKIKYSFYAGLAALILFQFHPFHLFTIVAVLAVYEFIIILKNKKINWYRIKHYLILAVLGLPPIIYHLLLMKFDWTVQQKAIQNLCLSPEFLFTITTFGFLLLLAIAGVYIILKNKDLSHEKIFLLSWFFIQGALLYGPIAFQRRLIEGWQIPIVLLSMETIWIIKAWLEKKKINWHYFSIVLLFLFIIGFALSNIRIIINDIALYSLQTPILYPHKEYIDAYRWLNENSDEQAIILSGVLLNGNLLPGFSGRTVYVGHGMETVFFEDKLNKMEWFFADNQQDAAKQKFLKDNNIGYIFYSPKEKKMGTFAPDEKKYLKKIYENGEVKIYKVEIEK